MSLVQFVDAFIHQVETLAREITQLTWPKHYLRLAIRGIFILIVHDMYMYLNLMWNTVHAYLSGDKNTQRIKNCHVEGFCRFSIFGVLGSSGATIYINFY